MYGISLDEYITMYITMYLSSLLLMGAQLLLIFFFLPQINSVRTLCWYYHAQISLGYLSRSRSARSQGALAWIPPNSDPERRICVQEFIRAVVLEAWQGREEMRERRNANKRCINEWLLLQATATQFHGGPSRECWTSLKIVRPRGEKARLFIHHFLSSPFRVALGEMNTLVLPA